MVIIPSLIVATKFGYRAAVAAKKFRHKERLSFIAKDTIYSVASLP